MEEPSEAEAGSAVGAAEEEPAEAVGAPPVGEAATDSEHSDYVLVEGLRSTRGAFERWRAEPRAVLAGWFGGAALVAIALLTGTWIVSLLLTPDLTILFIPGVNVDASFGDFVSILGKNSLVLALHATACVAGFIAGSSLPLAAEQMTGFRKIVHERAGPIAIGWVVAVTTFSLFAQSVALGFDAATLSRQFGIDSWLLILTVLPHALLELTAVFLPLAAWIIASRRREWGDLLAATIVTTAMAVPMLLVSALIEITLWHELLVLVSPVMS